MTDSDEVVIDWQLALETVDGQRELLAELIDVFFEEYPKLLVEIDEAIESSAAKDLQRSAHTLKGCLRYFGEPPAAQIAKQLEDLGRSGQFDGARQLLSELTPAVERILPLLRAYADKIPRDNGG